MKKQFTKQEMYKHSPLLSAFPVQNYVKPNAAQGLRDLFVDELKYLYWAESAYTRSIPNIIANASSDKLTETLETYIATAKIQLVRLSDIFAILSEPLESVRCEAMTGLIKEAEQMMMETEKGMVRDAAIISSTQKIHHCQIATYGTLCSFAKTLDQHTCASLLQTSLIEKKSADKILSEIAESSINIHANSVNDQSYDIYEL